MYLDTILPRSICPGHRPEPTLPAHIGESDSHRDNPIRAPVRALNYRCDRSIVIVGANSAYVATSIQQGGGDISAFWGDSPRS